MMNKIIYYTFTDEAPALSTYSLLPIIRMFACSVGIVIRICDISLASRIITKFPEFLSLKQRKPDDLKFLKSIVLSPYANIVKLPNISASLPQLKSAIREIQKQGYNIPNYMGNSNLLSSEEIKNRYEKIIGSAVNPVLRDGNSYRYVPMLIKNHIKKNPHYMGCWNISSLSHVSYMKEGDFYSSEKSTLVNHDKILNIIFTKQNGTQEYLKKDILANVGDIIDASVMRKKSLIKFISQQIIDAKNKNVLMSVHLKCTMMKVSDPIIFGIVVSEFYKEVFMEYHDILRKLQFNPNNGIGDFFEKIKHLSLDLRTKIISSIEKLYSNRPFLAMVDVENGITNLHAPNNVIIDSSMPTMIRNSGKMFGPDGKLHDVKAIIPDRCYAGIYQAIIEDCKVNGMFDPKIIGSISNIGLMAKKAEEYGSHDRTFQVQDDGIVHVVDNFDNVLIEHKVEKGDIWRLCQVKDVSIQNWIDFAITQSYKSRLPLVFWLDSSRKHDLNIIKKVKHYLLKNAINNKMNVKILSPVEAMYFSIRRMRIGKDTISATGNVLRDYLTDLFPIIESGSSSKTMSIIPLLSGGYLFETGSGGSAPNHVKQFIQENHFRWDSVGELLALSQALMRNFHYSYDEKVKILSQTLDQAICKLLDENKSPPSRKSGELDSRESHFYLSLFWSEMLAKQNKDLALNKYFKKIYFKLMNNAEEIIAEFSYIQGKPVNIGGYYHPNSFLVKKLMRPSAKFNSILNFTT